LGREGKGRREKRGKRRGGEMGSDRAAGFLILCAAAAVVPPSLPRVKIALLVVS
jgi:hypothetical protein